MDRNSYTSSLYEVILISFSFVNGNVLDWWIVLSLTDKEIKIKA